MAQCQGCGATIAWRKASATGKAAPVDPVPPPGMAGNVIVNEDGTYTVLTAAVLSYLTDGPGMFPDAQVEEAARLVADHPRTTLHFATCPNADHFRRCGKCHHTPCECP